MSFLQLSHLEKTFGQNRVVKDFTLSVEKGEFISLLGPSGCGKTTVLRMLAGFETPTSGQIHIDGQDVAGLKPNSRAIGMMFQAYALFPNLTVGENVAFGLKVKSVPRAERDERVNEMLKMIGLADLATRYPFQLSGGQQQRVALARALAPRPRVLLLDEPLSALDAKVRVSLRNEIRAIQRDLGITTIFVTHDQEEAMSISDRIVVMNAGIADQVGSPFEIYNRPATRFVAQFVGTLNSFTTQIVDPEKGLVLLGDQTLHLDQPVRGKAGDALDIALRPEALRIGAPSGDGNSLRAIVTEVHFMGSVIRLSAKIGQTVVSLDTFNRANQPPPQAGETIEISLSGRDTILL